jgi:small redox-active disulfide protein 2
MGLFNFSKKGGAKTKKGETCFACKVSEAQILKAESNQEEGSPVKVLGSGCAKCRALEANVLEAMQSLGLDDGVDHVTDFAAIASYGVMSTPALVIDGEVVSSGKLLSVEEAQLILKKRKV